MARTWTRQDLRWRGNQLYCGKVRLMEILPTGRPPCLWRVQLFDGRLSDATTRPRAKDAAVEIALAGLNAREKATEAA
jgi:hypothetical protein